MSGRKTHLAGDGADFRAQLWGSLTAGSANAAWSDKLARILIRVQG